MSIRRCCRAGGEPESYGDTVTHVRLTPGTAATSIVPSFTRIGSVNPGSGNLSGGVARALDHARRDGAGPPASRAVHTDASHFVDSRNATRTAASSFIAAAT